MTIQQPDRPQMTVEVPAGWRARENKRQLILTRDGRRVVVRQCRLDRADRDLTAAGPGATACRSAAAAA